MIRKLLPTELSLTKECAELFFWESRLPGKLNFEYWSNEWKSLIERYIGEIFVYEVDGKINGILGGLFWNCSMTADLEALEGFWFVKDEYRGGVGAVKLLRAFEDEAQKRGCKRIKMVHLMSVNPQDVEKLYIKMGYNMLQVSYVKELTLEHGGGSSLVNENENVQN